MANGNATNLPGNAQSAGAAAGDPRHFTGQLSKILKDSERRKVKTFRTKGVAILSTIITFDQFREAFDETFVSSVCPSAIIQSKSASKPLIMKTILYIPALCSSLPTPGPEFYGAMMKLKARVEGKKGKRQDVTRDQINFLKEKLSADNSAKAKRDFNRLSRYPVGFCVMTESQQIPSPLLPATLEFERDFDFSKCKVLSFGTIT